MAYRQSAMTFWRNVQKGSEDDCWPWMKSRNRGGYGKTSYADRCMGSHRVAYMFAVGPIPDGLWVLHSCDNRLCCNPKHLSLGTPAENSRQMVERQRAATGERNGHRTSPGRSPRGDQHWMRKQRGIYKGEKNPRAKLTSEQVSKIRVAIAAGSRSCDLADEYRVSRSLIWHIKTNRCWT